MNFFSLHNYSYILTYPYKYLHCTCDICNATFSVMVPDVYCCQNPEDRVILTTENGLLSNYMTQSSGCGGTDCPWVLEAPPGQMINLSVFDFSTLKMVSKCSHHFRQWQ